MRPCQFTVQRHVRSAATCAAAMASRPLPPPTTTLTVQRVRASAPSFVAVPVLFQAAYRIDTLVSENLALRSRVHRGCDLETGAAVAIKELWYDPADARSAAIAKLEVGMLFKVARSLHNPALVRRIAAYWDRASHRYYIVLPWYEGATLHELIVNSPQQRLPEDVAQRVFGQLVSAVKDLHSIGITHRDIKPSNVLVARAPHAPPASGSPHPDTVALADFGLAAAAGLWDVFSGRRVGTLEYQAPELLASTPSHSPAADVWALGVVLYNMLSGRPPFDPAHGPLQESIRRGRFQLSRRHFPGVSMEAKQVVRMCMQMQPLGRPSAAQLLDNPWVRTGLEAMQSAGAGAGTVGACAPPSPCQSSCTSRAQIDRDADAGRQPTSVASVASRDTSANSRASSTAGMFDKHPLKVRRLNATAHTYNKRAMLELQIAIVAPSRAARRGPGSPLVESSAIPTASQLLARTLRSGVSAMCIQGGACAAAA